MLHEVYSRMLPFKVDKEGGEVKESRYIGVLSVLIGAISYGMPGVVLSLAKKEQAHIENILSTQFLFSFVLFFILAECGANKNGNFKLKEKMIVLGTGIPMLCTTLFFYNAVYYLGVPTATLLMMQSAWIVPVLNSMIKKTRIKPHEVLSLTMIMVGVMFSTGIFRGEFTANYLGLAWGLGAGMSYSLVILSTANIANGIRVVDKAKLITFGAFLTSLFLFKDKIDISPISSDTYWSVINAIFSSILPVMLFGFGMPKTSSSLAGMLVTVELPAAFIFSYLILSDTINLDQIVGCSIIVLAIIVPEAIKIIRSRDTRTQ